MTPRSARFAWALCLVAFATAGSPATTGIAAQSPPPTRAPSSIAGFDLARLARMDAVINDAIADHKLPGAVVLVGRGDTIVWRKAYGSRALTPVREPMTLDTIFDLASLTKVVATTTAVMMLVEDGKIRLTDPVATFIPEFGKKGKERVTIRDLMIHMSGLRPDLDLTDPWSGADTAIALASDETLTSPPGRRFTYSDINFILLGEIVARVSRTSLDVFTRDRIFTPLGMKETMFLPPAALVPRIAPTEPCPVSKLPCGCAAPAAPPCGPAQTILRGVVHDPTSRRMGGVAGHAGLFSTAANLSVFCRMLLGGGAVGTTRILSPLTVGKMTAPATPAGDANVRGLGWDLDSSYSSNRGELLPLGSFGHTGFTGTSLWMEPATHVFIVFLSNRVHPDGKGDVTPLRAKIATIVASSLTGITSEAMRQMSWSRPAVPADAAATAGGAVTAAPTTAAAPSAPLPPVQTGIDVLRADGFSLLKGQRVGLLTNLTGRARDGATTIDLLANAPDVKLAALFSPEHGIRGVLDESVPSSKDDKTGLPIYSLYGQTERPTAAMLAGLDAIVIDLQDIGARFYTYTTTMAYVMEEAAAHKIKVIVLDRPNPIGGAMVEGPALDAGATSFIGYFPAMPIRHGMTIGELARLFNGERSINADLAVVSMKNWRRDEWFDETGQSWINPSPNMRTLYAATLYPGIGEFEYANISVGRGTDTPFEHVGAPWIDGVRLAEALNARRLPGVRFYSERFTPTASKFANTECQGVFITITDRAAVRPVRMGVEIASALLKLFPGQLQLDSSVRLFGSQEGLTRLKMGEDPAAIAASWTAAENLWRQLRAKYALY